jgi:hypothetical protein
VEIVELSADEVRAAADELGRLLLDAHEAGMALGLAGPLTVAHARGVWLETAWRSILGGAFCSLPSRTARSSGRCRSCGRSRRTGSTARRSSGSRCGRIAAAPGSARRCSTPRSRVPRGLGLELLWLTTHEDTGSDRFYEAVGWTRLGAMPLYSARPDGTLAGGAIYYLVL